ncbi:MAG: Ig-like domain-containing protein [Elusimicrobia bacterium]|nr:Ig-like domain-containing protein [Candidatus Liberimonas magnetica]
MFRKFLFVLTLCALGFMITPGAFAAGHIDGYLSYNGSAVGNWIVWLSTSDGSGGGAVPRSRGTSGDFCIQVLTPGTTWYQFNFVGTIFDNYYVHAMIDDPAKAHDYSSGSFPGWATTIVACKDPGEPTGKTSGTYYTGNDYGVSYGGNPVYVAIVDPEAPNVPPTTGLTAPASGASLNGDSASSAITITGTASDTDGSIAKVNFYVQQSWSPNFILISSGIYSTGVYINYNNNQYWKIYNDNNVASDAGAKLYMTAQDDDGAISTSTPRAIKILKQNTPKTITIVKPNQWAAVTGNVMINATIQGAGRADETSDFRVYISTIPGYLGVNSIAGTANDSVTYSTFTWNSMGLQTGTTAYIRVKTHLDASGTLYYYSNITTVTVNHANQNPTCGLVLPGSNLYGMAVISGTANDFEMQLKNWIFYVDGSLTAQGNLNPGENWPYPGFSITFNTDNLTNGSHNLKFVVYDQINSSGTYNISKTVNNTTPKVFIITPSSGAAVSGIVTISGTAQDRNGGSLQSAELYLTSSGGSYIASKTMSGNSFQFIWYSTGTANNTNKPIRVRVYDNEGGGFGEKLIYVNLYNAPNNVPVVTISTPIAGGHVVNPMIVKGTAVDSDSNITSIEFRVGDSLLQTIYMSTKTVVFNESINIATIQAGNRVLYVRAYQQGGGYGVASQGINVPLVSTAPAACGIVYPTNGLNITGPVTIMGTATGETSYSGVKVYVSNYSNFSSSTVFYMSSQGSGAYASVAQWSPTGNGTRYFKMISNTGIESPVVSVLANGGPSAKITYPTNDTIISGLITISGTAAADTIYSVQLKIADNNLFTSGLVTKTMTFSGGFYTTNWTPTTSGFKYMKMLASISGTSTQVESPVVNPTVNFSGTVGPTAKIVYPAIDQVITAATTISGTAYGGTVSGTPQVIVGADSSFTQNSGWMNMQVSSGCYFWNWPALENGVRYIKMKATINGTFVESSMTNVTVNNGSGVTPPTSSITYPFNNTTILGLVTVSGTCTGTNVDFIRLLVSNNFNGNYPVEIVPNEAIQATNNSTLYTFNWTPTGDGPRYLRMRVRSNGTDFQSALPAQVTVSGSGTMTDGNKIEGNIYYNVFPKISGIFRLIISTSSNINDRGAYKKNEPRYDWASPYTYFYHYTVTDVSPAGYYYIHALMDCDSDGIYDAGTEPHASADSSVQVTNTLKGVKDLYIENPPAVSYVKIHEPKAGTSVFGQVNVNIEAFKTGDTINKVEFYVDGTKVPYSDIYNTWVYDPFWANWQWNTSQLTAGTHVVSCKATTYTQGSIIISSVSVNVSATLLKKLSGNVMYNGNNPGNVRIEAFMGTTKDNKGPVVANASIPGPQYFSLTVPTTGSYYLQAFKDVNDNGSYDTGEPVSTYSGPWVLAGSLNEKGGIILDLFDTTSGGISKIEGNINYPGFRASKDLHIVLSTGAGLGQQGYDFVREIMLWDPPFPAWYSFSNLPADNYYITAYMEKNGIAGYQQGEPVGGYGMTVSTMPPVVIALVDQEQKYLDNFNIMNPGYNVDSTGQVYKAPVPGTGGTTGPIGGVPAPAQSINSVYGHIKSSETISTNAKVIVRVYDEFNPGQNYQREVFGLGFYKIENIPDISNCRVEAFVDYNFNFNADATEPKAKLESFSLMAASGTAASVEKNLFLAVGKVEKSAMTVTIRGKIQKNNGEPLGDATVRMYDTGGFDDFMMENDVLKSTKTTNSSWSRDSQNNTYNVELTSVTVYKSIDPLSGPFYWYEFKVSASGYKVAMQRENFSGTSGQVKYINITVETKPTITCSSLIITPASKEISPDNDGTDDRATFKFKYSVATSIKNWENGAQAKLIIDTDNNGQYSPMNWGIFVNIDGKEFIKWDSAAGRPDPSIFIDFMDPDYDKLKGPVTWEEKDKYSSGFDSTMDWWIDSWSLKPEGDALTANVEMVWEGRDNRWQPLKNGTYKWKLVLDDPGQFDETDGVIFSTTGTITIKGASIKGQVKAKDANGNLIPVEGAKVNAGGPNAWGEVFTSSAGVFEVSGLRVSGPNEYYYLSVDAKGYVRQEFMNLQILASGTLDIKDPVILESGVKVSGNLTIPNPPKKGTLRDNMGNQIFDLWGRIEAWRTDGPGWYSAEVRIPLSTATLAQITAPYELYLEPGNFNMQVTVPGYVSQTIDVAMGNSVKTQDISLSKSAVLAGQIKLPVGTSAELAALQEEAQKKGFWNSIWVNIHGESKDKKSNVNNGVNFAFFELQNSTTYAKEFRIDTLIPGTTYTFTVDTMGMFAMQQFSVVMPKTGGKNVGNIILSYGAKMKGKVIVADALGNRIESANFGGYMSMIGTTTPKGVPIYLDIRNTQTYSYHHMEVFISSTAAGTYDYEIRGLSSGWHEIEINGLGGVDIVPAIESRKVFVSTGTSKNPEGNTVTAASCPDITLKKPSGILRGAITNSTGRNIDWSKVAVSVSNMGGDGGEASDIVGVENDGTFTINNLITTDMVIFGTEYDVKPGEAGSKGGQFGSPSGRASTFLKTIKTQSGGTTTYFTAELKPASTIYVRINASTDTIKYIIAKTTGYIYTGSGSVPHITRIQPLTLRKLGEELERSYYGGKEIADDIDQRKGPGAKEVAFTGEYVPGLSSDTTAVFKLCGLEKGIYFAYPLVNYKMYIGATGVNGQRPPLLEYKYASFPLDKYIVLGENEEKYADFVLGSGVTLNGSITRPSGNYASAQTIDLSLRNPSSNDKVYSKTVTFSTSTRVNTQSFAFEKVSAGKYILVVKSADYKIYTKSIEITNVGGSEALAAIKLAKGATLTGRIVNEDGTGISDGVFVSCEAYPYVEGSYMDSNMANVTVSSDTATRGVFTFPNLPGGTYLAKASLNSSARTNLVAKIKAGITVPDSETVLDAGSLILKKATSIKGIVKESNGKPLANMRVQAYPVDSQRKENNELETKTDKDGVFVVKGVDPAIKNWAVKINVREDDTTKKAESSVNYGTALRFVDVAAKNDLGTVTLSVANALLTGTVKTPDNSQLTLPFPVEGINDADYPAALVILQSQDDLATGDPMSGAKVISTGSGEFALDGLVAGRYNLKVFAKKFATYTSTITIKSGENKTGDIVLAQGASVSGSIRTQAGKKISRSDASIVVAATRDFKKVVFGSLAVNPTTLEVDSYEIVGLEPGVNYFLVLVAPQTGKVYVDLKSTAAATSTTYINHPILYKKISPTFEAKAFKTTLAGSILKGEMNIQGQTIIFKGLFDDYDVDMSAIDINQVYNVYLILSFISQPVMEDDVRAIVSTTTASSGVFVPMSLADSRKALSIAYIPSAADITRGYFELQFSGRNSEGLVGSDNYKFYVGEDGRSEKVVNPMVGGNIALGEGDGTGIDIQSGVEFEGSDNDIAISSGVKMQVIKVQNETVVLAGPGTRFAPKRYAPQCFSTKLPAPSSYPADGTLMSSIYDLQVKLVSGPLATIASNSSVGIKVQISSAALSIPLDKQDDLGLFHYDTGTTKWVKEITGPLGSLVDWGNLLLSVNVNHFSKFAVFYVPSAPVIVPSTGTTVAADLSNVIVYPNPYKYGVTNYDGADSVKDKINIKNLTARAKIKLYNIAGELVNDYEKDDATSGTLQWDMKNKDGNKLASGVYIYYITNPDNSTHKAVGKFSIIK